MITDDRRQRAEQLIQEALREQTANQYDAAVRLYKESLALCPTAEGHTYLGWAYSFMGRLDDAIVECRRAIEIDPAFGNPYNDIGSYLMKQGKMEEAIPWLEQAKNALRYEPRHFPYLNLARLYLTLGRAEEAGREFAQAKFFHETIHHPDGDETSQPPTDSAVN